MLPYLIPRATALKHPKSGSHETKEQPVKGENKGESGTVDVSLNPEVEKDWRILNSKHETPSG